MLIKPGPTCSVLLPQIHSLKTLQSDRGSSGASAEEQDQDLRRGPPHRFIQTEQELPLIRAWSQERGGEGDGGRRGRGAAAERQPCTV
ncbi:hypothetical protein INR49_007278 [Caranx melampygus]|nr:hypothetical protein INR49_007278 [Caranx melampygus]